MRSAFSPNIRERRDFSCALFDHASEMIAQAAHIPVHLGSTPMSVQAITAAFSRAEMGPDDLFVVNDPFAGGTHLPDITVIAPVFVGAESSPRFFVANRAHHADVGGITPGSMPISRSIDEEGFRIGPSRLTDEVLERFCHASRTPDERRGDLQAQVAALHLGRERLKTLCEKHGADAVTEQASALQDYSERRVRRILSDMPDGVYSFEDVLDDDGFGTEDIRISLRMTLSGDGAAFDFTASSDQVGGPLNAVRAITVSAVSYCIRCLSDDDLPVNAGLMRPIAVMTRPGSVVDALPPSAVAGGNVETSQRIVDVVLGAMALALPDVVPAASSGTMSNITIGGIDPRTGEPFAYYETIAGGSGAGPSGAGSSGIHTHMTNTLNTPVEALEHAYPFRVEAYRIRSDSGGQGEFPGGDGVVRRYVFSGPATVTLLTERRRIGPYGLSGGGSGSPGENVLIRGGREEVLAGKTSLEVNDGDVIEIRTPGGGGWGRLQSG